MKELLPGVVKIYALHNFFVGFPESTVQHSHHNQYGAQGRVTTSVVLRGKVRRVQDITKLYESDRYDADIDGMAFELWITNVSAPQFDRQIDMWGLDPEFIVTFAGRRVAPTIHPVVAMRRARRG